MSTSVAVVPMDIHKLFSKCVTMDKGGRKLSETRVEHGDKRYMREFFKQFEPGTDVVMEATFNWPWIVDLAQEAGLVPHLAHSLRAREMAKEYSKTDRKDAIWLGKLFLAGEIFPAAYVAPRDVRDMRSLFRQRLLLVGMRVKMKNNVHGQLFRLGILTDSEATDLFGLKGRRYLSSLELSDHERGLLDQKLVTINHLSGEIRIIARRIRLALREDPRARIEMSLPGFGEITTYSVLAEIGEIGRFPNGRALAGYSGLLPLDKESAGKEKPEHTASRCNKYLQWAFLEAVTGAIKHSPRMRRLYERVKSRNGGRGGKARVAVARELAELTYLLLTRNEEYREEVEQGAPKENDPNQVSQIAPCVGSE